MLTFTVEVSLQTRVTALYLDKITEPLVVLPTTGGRWSLFQCCVLQYEAVSSVPSTAVSRHTKTSEISKWSLFCSPWDFFSELTVLIKY